MVRTSMVRASGHCWADYKGAHSMSRGLTEPVCLVVNDFHNAVFSDILPKITSFTDTQTLNI